MIFNAYTGGEASVLGLEIVSCGHIFAEKGRAISRPRGREDYLLFYVEKGCETFFLDREVQAEAGSFILFRPGEPQEHVCTSGKTSEFYYVHFTVDGSPLPLSVGSSRVYPGTPSSTVRDLFEGILEETELRLPAFHTVAVGRLLTLFGLLERGVSTEVGSSHENADRIAVVLRRMNREYAADHSLSDYAAMCSMSKFHFLRVFRSITGASPIEYRNRIRIEHAKALLSDTFLTVSEIGSRVGYASPSYFSDAFKKEVGISPKEYREACR